MEHLMCGIKATYDLMAQNKKNVQALKKTEKYHLCHQMAQSTRFLCLNTQQPKTINDIIRKFMSHPSDYIRSLN